MSDHIPHAPTPKPLYTAGLILAVVGIAVAATGIFVRVSHSNVLKKEVESQHVTVKVVLPQLGAGQLDGLRQPDGVNGDAVIVYAGVRVTLGDGIAQDLHQLDIALEQVAGEMDQIPVEQNDDRVEGQGGCQNDDDH